MRELVVATGAVVMRLLAQAEPVADLPTLAQYGLLGIAVLLLARFAFGSVRREQARGDRLEDQLRVAFTGSLERSVAVMEAATTAARANTDALGRIEVLLHDVERQLRAP